MKRIFTGISKNGKLIFDQPEAVEEHLRYEVNGKVEIIIRKPQDKRSIPQNNYYWGVIVKMISEEMGENQKEVHKMLKFEFLSIVAEIPTGKEYLFIRSTTDLTVSEWEDYMTKCRQWASENLNMFIPKPNEYDYNL